MTNNDEINDKREPPLLPDELLLRDNILSSVPMPETIAADLATQELFLTSNDQDFDPLKIITKVNHIDSTWQLKISNNTIFGFQGQTGTREDPATLVNPISDENQAKAFKPPWVNHIFHPKFTTSPKQPRIFTSTGNEIIPHFKYGDESRNPFQPTGYPWHCIGRLFIYDNASAMNWRGSGTAVLVGPRIVLTAGHLLPNNSNSWKMQFVPAYFNGSSILGSGAFSWVSDAKGWKKETISAYDMAVLRLYKPLGNDLGYFGAKVYNDDWQDKPYWCMVGYPGDVAKAQIPSREIGISVIDDDSDEDALEIEHLGDSTEGNSGGPLWSFWSDGFPYVIGTHSGGELITFLGAELENNNVAAGGKAMVDLINWARNNWP